MRVEAEGKGNESLVSERARATSTAERGHREGQANEMGIACARASHSRTNITAERGGQQKQNQKAPLAESVQEVGGCLITKGGGTERCCG
jgi:hypothetical protein